jgi:CRISPR-associated protein Cmx8
MATKAENNGQQLQIDFASTEKNKKNHNSEKTSKSKEDDCKTFIPLVYDSLDPSLTVLHRAGIAGLYVQIKAMEKLREDARDDQKDNYIIPNHKLSKDGRVLTINLTEESFHSLMRERYQGIMIDKKYKDKKTSAKKLNKPINNKDKRLVSEALQNGELFGRVFMKKDGEYFLYKERKPALNYFEVFNAPEIWQDHARSCSMSSFFCIPKNQEFFRIYSVNDVVSKSHELWSSLIGEPYKEIKKHTFPNSQGEDLKGIPLEESGKRGLILHFWSLVSTFFTPRGIKFDKGELKDEYHSPIIVVPAITNTGNFTEKFIQELGKLESSKEGKKRPEMFISAPIEAPLAFFAPRLAHYRVNSIIVGMRGVEVFTYSRYGKQAIIREITYESIKEELVEKYKDLSKIKSFPYRSLRVQNLIDDRKWHEGFDQLIARYPPDLFTAMKVNDGSRRFDCRAALMVQSIYDDFQFYSKKEKRMQSVSIETLIWRIVRNYVEWRACDKGKISEKERNELSHLRKNIAISENKTEAKKSLKNHKKIGDYNKAILDVTADLFINFRGRRDPTNFADAFCELFFRAPYHISPEQMEQLHPFLHGEDQESDKNWESGRRLVLMAISAAGALGSFGYSDSNGDNSDEEVYKDDESLEEE